MSSTDSRSATSAKPASSSPEMVTFTDNNESTLQTHPTDGKVTAQSISDSKEAAVPVSPASYSNDNPPQAHLLGIPTALLNQIITYATLSSECCHAPSHALARTCKAHEALTMPIYYGLNMFTFKSAGEASQWLSRTHHRQAYRAMTRSITYPIFGSNMFYGFNRFLVYLKDNSNELSMNLIVPGSRYLMVCKDCQDKAKRRIMEINGRCKDVPGSSIGAKLLDFVLWSDGVVTDSWERGSIKRMCFLCGE